MNEGVSILTREQLQSLLIEATKEGFHQCMAQLRQNEWLTIQEVCDYLKVEKKWVYRKSDPKKTAYPLPYHGPKGAQRWHRAEIDEWFKKESNKYSHLKTA